MGKILFTPIPTSVQHAINADVAAKASNADYATSAAKAAIATGLPTGDDGATEMVTTHGTVSPNTWYVTYGGANNYGGVRKYFAAYHADTADSAVDQYARDLANNRVPLTGAEMSGNLIGVNSYAAVRALKNSIVLNSAWGDAGINTHMHVFILQ